MLKRITQVLIACVVAFALPTSAFEANHGKEIDPLELQKFLDPLCHQQMDQLHIPGAVFVLVQNGRLLFAKGYGYADISRKSAVLPDKTLFRAGSISKLVTATLVMQEVESGRLALNVDVNKYLKSFQLKPYGSDPVTLRNLLTHTAGFDELTTGSRARTSSEMKPLGEYISLHQPPGIRAPGRIFSYSNYGFSLAGYLAQETAGVPFLQLAQQQIFKPLGMNRSSFQLDPARMKELATGYEYRNGRFVAVPPDYANTVPASGLVSCGTDMASFMLAHLQNGQYQNIRILSEQSAREMHKQQFTHHPNLSGIGFGFFERFTNGERAIWHDGDTGAFSSFLLLLPDRNLGYFLSFNSRSGGIAREEITKQFFDHYFPTTSKQAKALVEIAPQQLSRLSGTYRFNRYSHTSFEKIGVLAGIVPEMKVTVENNGLHLRDKHAVPVGNNLFEWNDSTGYVFFREDGSGKVEHLFFGSSLPRAYEKVRWFETARFHQILIAVVCATFLSGLVIWVVVLFRGRHIGVTKVARVAAWVLLGNAFLSLVFLTGLTVFLIAGANSISYGLSPLLRVLLIVPRILVVLTACQILFTLAAWLAGCWSISRRLHYTLMTLSGLAFAASLSYWRLVFPF